MRVTSIAAHMMPSSFCSEFERRIDVEGKQNRPLRRRVDGFGVARLSGLQNPMLDGENFRAVGKGQRLLAARRIDARRAQLLVLRKNVDPRSAQRAFELPLCALGRIHHETKVGTSFAGSGRRVSAFFHVVIRMNERGLHPLAVPSSCGPP